MTDINDVMKKIDAHIRTKPTIDALVDIFCMVEKEYGINPKDVYDAYIKKTGYKTCPECGLCHPNNESHFHI